MEDAPSADSYDIVQIKLNIPLYTDVNGMQIIYSIISVCITSDMIVEVL